jgi:hypothetical protein
MKHPALRYRDKLFLSASPFTEIAEKDYSWKLGFRYLTFSETGLPVFWVLGNSGA